MLDKARLERNLTELIIDLDSTHSDTFGNLEGTTIMPNMEQPVILL